MRVKPFMPKSFKKKMSALLISRDLFMLKHEKDWDALMLRCPHEWEFHSDPSGGSDSGYCCNLCHKWVKNKEAGNANL